MIATDAVQHTQNDRPQNSSTYSSTHSLLDSFARTFPGCDSSKGVAGRLTLSNFSHEHDIRGTPHLYIRRRNGRTSSPSCHLLTLLPQAAQAEGAKCLHTVNLSILLLANAKGICEACAGTNASTGDTLRGRRTCRTVEAIMLLEGRSPGGVV